MTTAVKISQQISNTCLLCPSMCFTEFMCAWFNAIGRSCFRAACSEALNRLRPRLVQLLLCKFGRDALATSSINCMTSFWAGFVIFSVLGYMSKRSGKPIDKVATEGNNCNQPIIFIDKRKPNISNFTYRFARRHFTYEFCD